MARPSKFSVQQQEDYLKTLIAEFGESATNKQILDFAEKSGSAIPYFILRDDSRKIGRGVYRLSGGSRYMGSTKGDSGDSSPVKEEVSTPAADAAPVAPVLHVASVTNIASKRAINVTESFVPGALSSYVPFGFHSDLRNILSSKIFYPIYITGLSGNGKTLMVEQVCAELGRELIRVNITKRTDETDLIGSYELIDGNTVRREGPVITAMRRGAVLLLDETDYGTEDLLCLQPILEGKPYFDKKTGEVIHPAHGFQVIATANTKGKGSDDGRFIGANVLNEAFLERFAITVEQEYPDVKIERKILAKNFETFGLPTKDSFIECLVQWADVIRKSYIDGAVDDLISTRRLVHIVKAYSIFNKDRMKAIELCLARFDAETKVAFLDLYTKVDAEVSTSDFVPVEDEYMDLAHELTKEWNSVVKITNVDAKTVNVESHGRKTTIRRSQLTGKDEKGNPINPKDVFNAEVKRHEFLQT
jgi:MoxR-like ATPase